VFHALSRRRGLVSSVLMKCPTCKKDLNENRVSIPNLETSSRKPVSVYDFGKSVLNEHGNASAFEHLRIAATECVFCHQSVLFVYAKEGDTTDKKGNNVPGELRLVLQYPGTETDFKVPPVPKTVVDAYHQAERCHTLAGSKVGAAAALRKCVMELCDDQGIGEDHLNKRIMKLNAPTEDKEILASIKTMGDELPKSGMDDNWSDKDIEIALGILPLIIQEVYERPEERRQVRNELMQRRQANKGSTTGGREDGGTSDD